MKEVFQLWTRQMIAALEVVLHVTLACYTLATREAPRNEGSWVEAALTRLGLALAWLLICLAEEHYHRRSTRVAPKLLLFYLLALVHSAWLLALAVLQLPASSVITLPAAWNVVPTALVAAMAVWGSMMEVAEHESDLPPTPEQTASLLSYTLFLWFSPVIAKGLSKRLDREDLPCLPQEDLSSSVWDKYKPIVAPLEHRASVVSE